MYRQNPGEMREIGIGCEYGNVASHRYRAKQKIGIRSLNPLLPAAIEKGGGFLEVSRLKLDIGKGAQFIA